MVSINRMLKDGESFYPETHQKAIVGLEDYTDGEFFEKPIFIESSYQKILNTWGEVNEFNISLTNNLDGLLIVNGWLSVQITGEATITFIPSIEQSENYTIKSNETLNRPYFKAKDSVVYVPFSNMFPISKGKGQSVFKVRCILEGSGQAEIRRKHLEYSFIPQSFNVIQANQHNKI